MSIICAIFDADGVVIDTEMFSVQYQKDFGVSPEEMIPFFDGEFKDCLIGKADLINIVEPWLPRWRWNGTVEEFLDFWFKAEHNIDERVISKIRQLRDNGIRCYMATNQEKYRTQYMKDHMGFERIFDHVFSSAKIGYKKPQKEFFEFILDELKNEHKIYPHEIMYFDDTKRNVVSAKEMDIDAHLYVNFQDFENIIDSLI